MNGRLMKMELDGDINKDKIFKKYEKSFTQF